MALDGQTFMLLSVAIKRAGANAKFLIKQLGGRRVRGYYACLVQGTERGGIGWLILYST